MTTNITFKSDAFESIHESAQALPRVGAIGKTTLRKFDAACLYHLGIRPGEKVTVSIEPDRTIRLSPAKQKLSLDEVLANIGKADVWGCSSAAGATLSAGKAERRQASARRAKANERKQFREANA